MLKINIVTEKPGWITYRLASELASGLENSKIISGLASKFYFISALKNILSLNIATEINYFLTYYLMPKYKKKNVIDVACLTHLELDNDFKTKGWERCLENADYFVAISEFTIQQALNLGVEKDKIEVIKYGVDDIYKENFNILLVGAAGKRKGLNFFEHLRSILSEESGFQWKSASENGWGIDSLNLNPNDLRIAYSWADVRIVTSELEGAHTGTLEALYSGLKVLSRPVGWAANELRDFVEIYETPNDMAIRLKNLRDIKFKEILPMLEGLKLNDFTYDKWRIEHNNLFTKLSNRVKNS